MNAAWLRKAEPQRRFGIKGPGAAELLKQLKLSVPERPNSWSPLRFSDRDDSWNVIGRLGSTEFFIEEAGEAPGIAALGQLIAGAAGAYPVLREDCAVVLGGAGASDVLAQVCNVNFAALPAHAVVMTLMIGVSVLVMPQRTDDGLVYRIWCDPSFGSYLQSELEQMVNP
jgi:sarcosine oxidase subunit gamma